MMLDFGFYNMDCMKGMAEFPDAFFDLAIVDPPYGIKYDKQCAANGGTKYGNAATEKKIYHTSNWDNNRPSKLYFDELMRVSKKQIIWGGNYFSDLLYPTKSFVVWDKKITTNASNEFSDCEFAWMSNGMGVARMFRFLWSGMLQGNMKNKEYRIHPTQKPVALYKWLIERYMPEGGCMLDTHVGSASSLVACRELGFKYVGFEIDKDYYDMAKKRLDAAEAQSNIFDFLEK